jgi:thymidylate synthase (FAD)
LETTEPKAQRASELFEKMGGTVVDGFPAIHSSVHHTRAGTPYLKSPGVIMLARPRTNVAGLAGFLEGFDPSLGFTEYLDDPTQLPDSSQLCKTAGQTCYMSFGPRRTKNENAAAYIERLTSAGHGSVLEHASFSFLLYGVSRSVTHELVRHRAGVGFCLTGDTLIYSDHFCNGRREGVNKRSMAQLYEMTKTSHGRSRLKLLRPRSLDEETGTFTQGRVREVVCSGVKPVFKVELEDDKSITCSKDHRFLTADGWKPLYKITNGLEISPGGFAVHGALDTEILVNGIPAHRDRNWLTQQYIERNHSITEVAELAGVSTVTLKKWLRKYGLKKPMGVRTRWTFANAGKLYADRTWLEEQYVFKGLDQASIARLAGVSRHTIRARVRKHGLQKPMGSWSVGQTPWNKGKRYRAGWSHTPEMRRRLAEHKRGEKNPQWKGGITKKAISIRRGVEDLRPQILERDGYRCRLCGARGGSSMRLDMHHVLPVRARPDLVLDIDNIATVCHPCHLKIGGREMEYAERFGRIPEKEDLAKPQPRAKRRLFVPRSVRVKSVTYAGEQMTYDLEMEGPNHNFVANGIVTHNSQISQRYVSGAVLRFVERPEYQGDEELHRLFEERADRAAAEYGAMADRLLERQEGGDSMLSADYKTDARKKVQQTARSVLPNETEAPMVFTGNVRALRHIIEMRADAHAESEIRNLAVRIFLCLVRADPILFGDYSIGELPDGTYTVTTEYRKA